MAFINIVSPSRATGEVAEVYRYMSEVSGGVAQVANIVRMFSPRAGSMRRMIRTWELVMWCGDEPREQREFVAAMVSRHNDCHY